MCAWHGQRQRVCPPAGHKSRGGHSTTASGEGGHRGDLEERDPRGRVSQVLEGFSRQGPATWGTLGESGQQTACSGRREVTGNGKQWDARDKRPDGEERKASVQPPIKYDTLTRVFISTPSKPH